MTWSNHKHPRIVISLTSYPGRMPGLHLTIQSLKNQTVPADLLVVWLAKSQFPRGMDDVPAAVRMALSPDCIIKWCEDYGSYKKLIPALIAYPESMIITVDDDVIYEKRLVEKLLRGGREHPSCVVASRVTKLNRLSDVLFIDTGGHSYWEEPSYLNKLVGCAGCLYPPGVLDKEVLNVEAFQRLAPTSDDIWFWLMAVRNNTKVYRIADGEWLPRRNPINAAVTPLSQVNDGDAGLFYTHLDNVLAAYPELRDALLSEKVPSCAMDASSAFYSVLANMSYELRRLPLVRQLYIRYLGRKNDRLASTRFFQRRVMQLERRIAEDMEDGNEDS